MGSGSWTSKDEADALRRAQERAKDSSRTSEQHKQDAKDIQFWKRSLAEGNQQGR